MNQTTLPDKPSELIRLALHDLELCEQDPRYEVNMNKWHKPYNGTCLVCLAGSVLAKTLNVDAGAKYEPDPLNEIYEQLIALDEFRCGWVLTGLQTLGITLSPESIAHLGHTHSRIRIIAQYEDDPAQFKADMHQLASDLDSIGL